MDAIDSYGFRWSLCTSTDVILDSAGLKTCRSPIVGCGSPMLSSRPLHTECSHCRRWIQLALSTPADISRIVDPFSLIGEKQFLPARRRVTAFAAREVCGEVFHVNL